MLKPQTILQKFLQTASVMDNKLVSKNVMLVVNPYENY